VAVVEAVFDEWDVYLEWNQTYGTKATGGEDTESDDESNDDEDAT
jgi:hypothetical protein